MSYEKYKSEVKRTNSPGHSIRPISQKRYEEHASPAKSKAIEKKKEFGDREMAKRGGHKFHTVKKDLDIK